MYSQSHYSNGNGSTAVGDLPKCQFPTTPRMSSTVKSLLEISESMDIAFLRSKLESTKKVNNFGPWMFDDKWSPRKQRSERNNRKQAARLLLSKRTPTSENLLFPKTVGELFDERYENSNSNNMHHYVGGDSNHEIMDPYFKKRPSTVSGAQSQSAVSSTTTKDIEIPGSIPAYSQTPSLPTLITLQSPNNKDFHSAFSLGKVDHAETERAVATYLPYSSHSNNAYFPRKTKSSVSVNHKPDELIQDPITCSEYSTAPPNVHNTETHNNFTRAQETRHVNNDNQRNDLIVNETARLDNIINNSPNMVNTKQRYNNNKNTNNNTITTSGNNIYPDRFDTLTSPPENPKILKILAQRKPAPPVCEFEDISVHIRHYRIYHTVRFTGRFSLANNQTTQEVRPVQWSEVFPHRPLSVSTTSVPVFRFKVEDFSQTKTEQLKEKENPTLSGSITEAEAKTGNDIDTDARTGNGKDESANTDSNNSGSDQEHMLCSRRVTPKLKDKDAKIDLSPTVTPVLKINHKKSEKKQSKVDSAEEKKELESSREYSKCEIHGVNTLKRDQSAENVHQDENRFDLGEVKPNDNDCLIQTSESRGDSIKLQKFNKSCVKNDNDFILFDEEPTTRGDSKHVECVSESQSSCDLRGYSKDQVREESDRDAERVLFSYREFLKRSVSNGSKREMYSPRFRHTRESPATPSDRKRPSEGGWGYPPKHGAMSILGSENELRSQNWRNIIIDEKQLRTSVDEKITGCNLSSRRLLKSQDEIGDKFVKFMIKQEHCQKSRDSYPLERRKSDNLRRVKEKNNSDGDNIDGIDESCSEICGQTNSYGVVSAYDCNGLNSDQEDIDECTGEDVPGKECRKFNQPTSVSTPRRKYWCPKLSQLSARARADNHKLESRRELISSAFRYKPVTPNSSAFVIAVPPPNVGFDDRGLVLPLQDFMHLAMMNGNERTFSKFSKSINNNSKVGLSPNMTIRSGSGRRSMDDGIVRVVTFASPVNQFIFAKKITGYSSQSRSVSVSDGTFVDAEDKGRSVFQRRNRGSFRLRLKDVGMQRPVENNDLSESNIKKGIGSTSDDETPDQKHKNEADEVKSDFGEEQPTNKNESKICEKKYYKIYVPQEGKESSNENENDIENDISEGRELSIPPCQIMDYDNCGIESHEPRSSASRSKQVKEEEDERARSSLRQHVVKLAELRASSKLSERQIVDDFVSEEADPPSSPYRNMMGIPGITPSYDINILANTKSFTNDESDNLKHTRNYSDDMDITNESRSFVRGKISFRQKCQSRQKTKVLPRNRLSKSDTIIHKDVQEDNPKSAAAGSIKPEGNPLMYSKVIRGSCLKKDLTTEQKDRPKTVRFNCDGVEYKMVERDADKRV